MCSIFHNTRKQFKIHVWNTNKTSGLSRLVQIKTTTVLFCCNLLAVATCQCYQTATDSTTTLLGIISPDKERSVQSNGCCFWLFHTQPNQLLKRLVINKCNICIVNRIFKIIFVLLKINVVQNKMCYIYSSTIYYTKRV